jgi:hypothetical protein
VEGVEEGRVQREPGHVEAEHDPDWRLGRRRVGSVAEELREELREGAFVEHSFFRGGLMPFGKRTGGIFVLLENGGACETTPYCCT